MIMAEIQQRVEIQFMLIMLMFKFKQWLILLLIGGVLSADPQLNKHIIPVFGNASLGYFYVNLYIGTPPQKQSVIVDTGSGQLALPCSQCISCGKQHLERPFDLRKSSTNKIMTCNSQTDLCKEQCYQSGPNPCTFSISYAEGSSLSGILIEDQIQFQQKSQGEAITTVFGCTTKETNLFFTQAANGIFGLAPKRRSRLLELLYEKHSKYTGQQFLFSMCLSKNGGQIAIGKISEELIKGKTSVKTKFNPYRNLYSLQKVGKIKMGMTTILQRSDFGYYGMFIDSGSTFTYFRQQQYKEFIKQVQASCYFASSKCKMAQRSAMNCYLIEPSQNQTLSKALLSIFPSIDIEINGQIVSWLPNRYFISRRSRRNEVCLGVQSLDRFLLGGNWMADKNIIFNLKQQTVQIYSQVKCTQESQILDYPLEYQDNSGSLTYISAVLNIDQNLLGKILQFILITAIIVISLIGLGMYVFKRENQESAGSKKKSVIQEEASEIVNIKSEQSARENPLRSQDTLDKSIDGE